MPTRNLLALLSFAFMGASPQPDPLCAALSAPYTLASDPDGTLTRERVREAVRARVDAIQRASGESLTVRLLWHPDHRTVTLSARGGTCLVHIAHARAFAAGRGNLTI